jgi:tyrosine phenol-lyase
MLKTPIEPYRIKAVDPIRIGTLEEREEILGAVGYNLFRVPAAAVVVDLLTDSGTGAMSANQWSALMRGDESYAGSNSFFRLRDAVEKRFGFRQVLPVHQGRAAERIAFSLLAGRGSRVISNTHFDTTRANVEFTGATAVDAPVSVALDTADSAPFKGDFDLDALDREFARRGRVGAVIATITNNALGGHPLSLANLVQVRRRCTAERVPLLLDAARFAENAWLARQRDPALSGETVAEVVRRYFDLSDGFLLSAKKDALCHIGGLLAFRDESLMERARALLVLSEGFITYGGLAGRDLEAMAVGLDEAVDPTYLEHRAVFARHLFDALEAARVPCVRPPGLHAVYVDAGRLLPQVPPGEFPGHALALELYRLAGVRACDVGTLMRGDSWKGPELLRLALPRRTYTRSHLDYVAEACAEVASRRQSLSGYRVVGQAGALRHFMAAFAPASAVPARARGRNGDTRRAAAEARRHV